MVEMSFDLLHWKDIKQLTDITLAHISKRYMVHVYAWLTIHTPYIVIKFNKNNHSFIKCPLPYDMHSSYGKGGSLVNKEPLSFSFNLQ